MFPTYHVRMGKRLAEERHRQLRTTGRVDVPQSVGHSLLLIVFAIVFIVIGAAMLYATIEASDEWTEAFTGLGAWIGLLSLLFGAVGFVGVLIQMRWRAVLTLTWDGIAEHRMKKGERVTVSMTAWRDITGFSGMYLGGRWPFKGQYTVFMHLVPDAYAAYRAGLSPTMRRLDSANASMFGHGRIALRRFSGGPKALHELLDRAHRDFGAPPGPGHHWV